MSLENTKKKKKTKKKNISSAAVKISTLRVKY